MFRQKNSNTKMKNVEATYGIDLNARGDATLEISFGEEVFSRNHSFSGRSGASSQSMHRKGGYFSASTRRIVFR